MFGNSIASTGDGKRLKTFTLTINFVNGTHTSQLKLHHSLGKNLLSNNWANINLLKEYFIVCDDSLNFCSFSCSVLGPSYLVL